MIRFGVDFGGTKIEAAALDSENRFLARVRAPSPDGYAASLEAVRDLVTEAEAQSGARAREVGVGGPGSPSPETGLIRNANSLQLNGRPFPADLARVLARPVRYANDANCLALSESVDGAGAGSSVVFAAILGTGVGSGIAIDQRIVEGRNAIAGEWGHTPLPWSQPGEHPGPECWCGRRGCLEQWVSGPALARDSGQSAEDAVAANGQALDRYINRLARGLAMICDILDPDVIVLGGGLSNVAALYDRLPTAIAPHIFSDVFTTPMRRALHGDSSGVRGAAWLWSAGRDR